MARITAAARLTVRAEAEKFLAKYGFMHPPLPPDEAIAARKLEIVPLSLDDLLVKANLPPHKQAKIQAVLDINERAIVFRSGLGLQRQNWGKLHEVGHEFLPWHKELLYCCPLLWLPAHQLDQLEAEADIFAAEAFFFGGQFTKLSAEGDFGLHTAKQLAEQVYGTSYHATFTHYVEESNVPCCLLVWKPIQEALSIRPISQLGLLYYIKSDEFSGHFQPGMITENEKLLDIINSHHNDVVKHEMQIDLGQGELEVVQAESFCNSYNVFTLVIQQKGS
ncbi:MAG: hypothetical protein A2Z69_00515 [Bacteroidetes bacterium RBG_13_44_24]|nr:MAG: hypothetical protein A2Z69_00515 [Bacteroidetes bacterium RBG_13_44_24]